MPHILNNPVWEALGSSQGHLNVGRDPLRYFAADVSPFIGMEKWDNEAQQVLLNNTPDGRAFSVMIAEQVELLDNWEQLFSIPLYQMICPALKPHHIHDGIRVLGEPDVDAMLDLTGRTKPGPFFRHTLDMGRYFGIHDGETLASMAGERLRLPGYTEVSAICTDPQFLGRGYASALTSFVCARIMAEGNTPFLHVRQDNTRAIDVYRKLGFEVRADVFFAVIRPR